MVLDPGTPAPTLDAGPRSTGQNPYQSSGHSRKPVTYYSGDTIPGTNHKSLKPRRPKIEWEHRILDLVEANGEQVCAAVLDPNTPYAVENGSSGRGEHGPVPLVRWIHDLQTGQSTKDSPQWGRRREGFSQSSHFEAPADFVQALNRRDPAYKHSKSFRLLSHGEVAKGAVSRPTYLAWRPSGNHLRKESTTRRPRKGGGKGWRGVPVTMSDTKA